VCAAAGGCWRITGGLSTRHIVPTLGKQRLDRVRPEHLTKLYREKVAVGLSPATVRYVHAVIRAALGLVRAGRYPAVPGARSAAHGGDETDDEEQ
jgi:hypothetical protein